MRPAKTRISLGIDAQSDQSLHCVDAQADLSLRWAHNHFCHEAAHIINMLETPHLPFTGDNYCKNQTNLDAPKMCPKVHTVYTLIRLSEAVRSESSVSPHLSV